MKGTTPPVLPLNTFLNLTTEVSSDMVVMESCKAVSCFQRDCDTEGNHYAWYIVSDYSCEIDRSRQFDAALSAVRKQINAVEDAACELDENTTDRLSAIEDALCDLDELLNGGDNHG